MPRKRFTNKQVAFALRQADARRACFRYINDFYDSMRRHSNTARPSSTNRKRSRTRYLPLFSQAP